MIHKSLAIADLTKGTTYKTKPHTYTAIDNTLLTATTIHESLQTSL